MNEILSINDTTYEVKLAGSDNVEIGDKEAVDFKPHLKLNRWDGECFIKVSLPTTEKIVPIVEAGRVKWRGQKLEAHFYPLEPTAQNELGGFEFEIILKEKPATNQIVFDIQAQGLRFSYQPPLTQQEIDAGAARPDNVIGSYAVYHATKKNNQYMAGKAFHIYRPQAEDADGEKVWCSIHIDKYINPASLTLTIPQQFLDEAVYPVTIDPDLGDTGIGGTWAYIAYNANQSHRRGSAWTMPAAGQVANYIKAYIGADGGAGTVDCKAFINQKDSGGAGTHGQIATKENLACAAALHWEQFNLAGEALTNGVVYILNIIGDGTDTPPAPGFYYIIRYDNNGTVASFEEIYLDGYAAPENPWIDAADGTPRDYSIYLNYSPPAPPYSPATRSANMGSKMIAGKLI